MKLLFIILFASTAFAQVIISPYIVLVDHQNKFGSFIVQNQSEEPYEISVSFIFGFPTSDSTGTISMKYIEDPDSTYASAVKWIKAFPRKFILEPGQRQVIRMQLQPDKELAPGTYWSRIVTSSVPLTESSDTLKQGISAKIKFVLNQVTTLLYRVEPSQSQSKIGDITITADSLYHNFFIHVNREGNSPFFGKMDFAVYTKGGEKVFETVEYLSLYFELNKRIKVDLKLLPPGSYTAEIKITHHEKEDIPESTLNTSEPVTEKLSFDITEQK